MHLTASHIENTLFYKEEVNGFQISNQQSQKSPVTWMLALNRFTNAVKVINKSTLVVIAEDYFEKEYCWPCEKTNIFLKSHVLKSSEAAWCLLVAMLKELPKLHLKYFFR